MGKKRDTDQGPAERTAARDFVMARLAAARVYATEAIDNIDAALAAFIAPDEDRKGEQRAEALEGADEFLGLAAGTVQAAQEMWPEVDPREGEAPHGDDEDEDEDDSEEED